MTSAKHDINVDRGSSFKLFVEYQTSGSVGIDLSGYTADLQVRRHIDASGILLHFSGNTYERGLTGGGSTGEYVVGATYDGTSGSGGIYLNAGSTGTTAGITGGIFVLADHTSMKNVPKGRHFYDLELTATDGTVSRIVEGRFNVSSDVTR